MAMTRRERVTRKASRLRMKAIRASIRSTNSRKPFSWAAIRNGIRADHYWAQARLLMIALAEREAAAKREKKAKKLPTDWWKGR
jgi:hypothetical protein